jgi:hypothetical protein
MVVIDIQWRSYILGQTVFCLQFFLERFTKNVVNIKNEDIVSLYRMTRLLSKSDTVKKNYSVFSENIVVKSFRPKRINDKNSTE